MSEIYDPMIQPVGAAYRKSQVVWYSHYNDAIDRAPGRLAGNSRVWGDATPEVQSRAIDVLIDAAERAGLGVRETAHVLAIARVESGFNPDAAAAESSAVGLGQFVKKTGLGYGIDDSNRGDVHKQAEALVAHFMDNAELARNKGESEAHVYKYHHDGPAANSNGLRISIARVAPYIDEYESFVREHRLKRGLAQDSPSKVPLEKGVAVDANLGEDSAAKHDGRIMSQASARTLQKQLNQLEMTDASGQPLKVDGAYGPRTSQAIARFQQEKGLSVTGKPDEATREAIHAYVVVGELEARKAARQTDAATMANSAPAEPAKAEIAPALRGSASEPEARAPSRETAVDHADLHRGAHVAVGMEAASTDRAAPRETYAAAASGQPDLRSAAVEPTNPEPLARGAADMPDHSGFGAPARLSSAASEARDKPTYQDAVHPGHRLYQTLREKLPVEVSDEHVAHLTQLGRRCGVREDEIQKVGVRGDRAFVLGLAPSAQVAVSLSAPAPSIEETMRESETFDRHQAQQRGSQQERSAERQASAMQV